MGIVSTVLSFIGKDVKVDRGSGDNVTAQHFGPSGDDSPPLPGDYAVLSNAAGTGRQSSVGYRDAKNEGTAVPGEKRLYARDESGAIVSTVWLKGTGDIEIQNGSANIVLQPGGDIVLNGIRITPDGDMIFPNGVAFLSHKHTQGADSDGNTEQDTGGPIA